MTEAQLPPLGAEVELLIEHCRELYRRFSNRSDDSFVLCVAWIQQCAKRILDSLPNRREFNRLPESPPDSPPDLPPGL